jgi:hypothetical protein
MARCHFTGPKKSRFPGPNPLPLALVMDLFCTHQKPYAQDHINHRCIAIISLRRCPRLKSAFEVDMLDEEEKKDVTCSQCGAIFAFKFSLKRHVSL